MPIAIIGTLLVFQVLLIFVHLAVYATLAAAFGIGGVWLKIIFVLLAFTFTVASFAGHWFKGKIIDWWYTFSAYWFGLVHFLFGGAVLFYFTLVIFYHANVYVNPALVGGVYFGIFFLIHLYGTRKSWGREITQIKISPSTSAGVWPSFDHNFWKNKKLVFISDVHLGNIRGAGFMASIVKKIQAIGPYAVFIGGDIFDGPKCDEEKLLEPLKALRPEHGVYYVTGNHEYYLPDVQHALKVIKNTGAIILHNEKVEIGGIDFVGVDYQSVNKTDKFQKVLNDLHIDRTKPNILIKHEPNDLDVAEKAGISLGFFGHTHQGQIWPLSLFTRQIYDGFDYGLKPHGTMQVYTSSGVGTWGPPLRLGTKSEIVVIEFI
jgi:predicted MPP superfamily phosphohydrolase